jgi:hypothetical protein
MGPAPMRRVRPRIRRSLVRAARDRGCPPSVAQPRRRTPTSYSASGSTAMAWLMLQLSEATKIYVGHSQRAGCCKLEAIRAFEKTFCRSQIARPTVLQPLEDMIKQLSYILKFVVLPSTLCATRFDEKYAGTIESARTLRIGIVDGTVEVSGFYVFVQCSARRTEDRCRPLVYTDFLTGNHLIA